MTLTGTDLRRLAKEIEHDLSDTYDVINAATTSPKTFERACRRRRILMNNREKALVLALMLEALADMDADSREEAA